MHKGRAVCCAVGEADFGRLAGMGEAFDHLHPARARLTVSGVRDRVPSETDNPPEPIPEPWMPRHPRDSDSPAHMRGFLFLAV